MALQHRTNQFPSRDIIAPDFRSRTVRVNPCAFLRDLFPAVVLLLAAGAGFQWLGEGDATAGNRVSQVVWFAIYGVSSLLLLSRLSRLRPALMAGLAAWPLLVISVASVGWSLDPAVSFRRMIALVGSTVFAIYLGTRFDLRHLFRIILIATSLGVALSFLLVVLSPASGISTVPFQEGWTGIFAQKNWLGRFAAVSFVAWLLVLAGRSSHPLFAMFMTSLSAGLVVQSGSRTAVVVALAMLLVIGVLPLIRLHLSLAIPSLTTIMIASIVVLQLLIANADALAQLLGRDPQLTGRAPLWNLLRDYIAERAWLGHGYGAFWRDALGPSQEVSARAGWDVPNSHNGYLDLLLDLGLVGLAFLTIALLAFATRALVCARRSAEPAQQFPLVFLTFLLPVNVAESFLLQHNSLFWILLVALLISMAPATSAYSPTTHSTSTLRRPVAP